MAKYYDSKLEWSKDHNIMEMFFDPEKQTCDMIEFLEKKKDEIFEEKEEKPLSYDKTGHIMQLRGDRKWIIGKFIRKKETGVM